MIRRGSALCQLGVKNPTVLLAAAKDLALAEVDSMSAHIDPPEVVEVTNLARRAYEMLQKGLDCSALATIEDLVPTATALSVSSIRDTHIELQLAIERYNLAVGATVTKIMRGPIWVPALAGGLLGIGLLVATISKATRQSGSGWTS
jgi:hypothetical protein